MAEENRSKRTTFEDIIFMLFALMLVGQALNRLPVLLQEHFGIDIGSKYLVATAALGADTPLGTQVNTPQGTPYYDDAGPAGKELGTFAPGTSLTIIDGPKTVVGGERWWFVEDTSGSESGWVPESALVHEGIGGLSQGTGLGAKVRALMAAPVWDAAGGLKQVGELVKGQYGEITKGPEMAHGSRWWYFDGEGDTADGWVTEAVLVLASDAAWHTGSRVRATDGTDLFERAGGGRAVGYFVHGGKATVIGGPIEVGGTYWWLVETDDGTQGWVSERVLEDAGIKGWFRGALATLLVIGIVLTLGLLGGIIYATLRTNQIRAREARRIREAIPKAMQPKRNERWDKLIEHASSENPNDWRLAIIEADVMLDELITRMGYHGTTLGDKLKQVTRGDVRSIDAAWEAHRVRNQIAHEGSDFILTKREAQRVVNLYGSVFKEFKYI